MNNKFFKTAQLSLLTQFNDGVLYLLPNIAVKIICLIPLMFLWRVIAESNPDAEMNLSQFLSYTYISVLFSELLAVKTFASEWCYDGKLNTLFTRPYPIFAQITAQTAGSWIPMLLLFSLPMLCIAPLLGINVIPCSPWFFFSLPLCISLGFAIDFFYICITVRMRGMVWLSEVIRMALISLFSGTVIPFKILPFGLSGFFEYQPFGSLGGAPLSLLTGTGDPLKIILMQIFWNLVIWPAAVIWFRKSQERMVSFGG